MKNVFKLSFLTLAIALTFAACGSSQQATEDIDSTGIDTTMISTDTTLVDTVAIDTALNQ